MNSYGAVAQHLFVKYTAAQHKQAEELCSQGLLQEIIEM
jgi:hypothetical protein